MKWEHRTQKVLPLRLFARRFFRYLFLAFFLVFVSVFIGTMGYHQIGGLDLIDSFHMACMILTGMGPVAEMNTTAAKLFSSFYALYSGVAFLSISAVFFAPMVHRLLHILHVEREGEDD